MAIRMPANQMEWKEGVLAEAAAMRAYPSIWLVEDSNIWNFCSSDSNAHLGKLLKSSKSK